MNSNKLTYQEILKLASNEEFDKIPEEYNLILRGFKPGIVFDGNVCPDNIEFLVNPLSLPIPEKAYLTCESVIYIPNGFSKKLLDFGDVFINTSFEATKMQFVYNSKINIEQYINTFTKKILEKPIAKKNNVFDVKFNFQNLIVNVYNVFPKKITFLDENKQDVLIDLIYDFIDIVI